MVKQNGKDESETVEISRQTLEKVNKVLKILEIESKKKKLTRDFLYKAISGQRY